jgi:hypothetical protein
MPDEMVVIGIYQSELEAEAARGRLEVEGIRAAVFTDDAGGMFPSMQRFTGVRLVVPSGEAEQAREVLDSADERGEEEEAREDEDGA